MQIAEQYRQQAREEAAKAKRKMTDAQKAKLAALTEERDREQAALVAFAQRIAEYEPTLQNLAKLIFACSGGHAQHLTRRAWKLKHWLFRGYVLGGCGKEGTSGEINSPTEVGLFSELTRDEERMTQERFEREWPHDVKPITRFKTCTNGKRHRASKRAKALVWSKEEKSPLQITQIQ